MNKFESKNIALLIAGFLTGCVPPYQAYNRPYSLDTYSSLANKESYLANYDIELVKTEPPKKSVKDSITSSIDSKFEDKKISITWQPTVLGFNFTLENKSDHSIKIVWDESVFVDEGGISHKIIHSGVKYNERNDSHPPTVIVKGGKLEDMVYPVDYVRWKEGYYSRYYSRSGEWDESPILPASEYGGSSERQKLLDQANSYIGKKLQVLLSIEYEGVSNEYLFTLEVKGVEVKKA